MKLFNYAKEQQLVRKLQTIHDEIFSQPAKRYVFYMKMHEYGGAWGTIAYAYDFLNNEIENIVFGNKMPELNFGDKLTVISFEKKEFSDNTISFKKNYFKNLPKHNAIIVDCDFLHARQIATLYRETMENYEKGKRKDVEITQLISLNYVLKRMEKGEVE